MLGEFNKIGNKPLKEVDFYKKGSYGLFVAWKGNDIYSLHPL
jgi:hypothetical protein